jgi:hypothetical protein
VRLFLASMTLGIGYLLVYAGFHPSGPLSDHEYALRPWRSLMNEDDLAAEQAQAQQDAQTAATQRAAGAERVWHTESGGVPIRF